MVLTIKFGGKYIRVYERHKGSGETSKVLYRSTFTPLGQKRLWGTPATSIKSTVASLLPKLKLSKEDSEIVWDKAVKESDKIKYAISHKSRINICPPAVVYFKKHPFEGIVQHRVRKADGKVRMWLSRKGDERVSSNWHFTSNDAFECIRAKCISKCRDVPTEVPAISHARSVEAGVKYVHQVYGLFRDGKDMSALFKLSSSAWQAYAMRHHAEYKLWTADECDR